MLRPAFLGGEDSCFCDMCSRVVFFPEALRDPEAWLVIVAVRARLFFALSDLCVSFRFGVVVPVYSGVCVEDV